MRLVTAMLLAFLSVDPAAASPRPTDDEVRQVVAEEISKALGADGAGAAVAIRKDGRTLFFNFGWADRAKRRPVTSDSLFNLGSVSKVFDATLLSLAVGAGELTLDDAVDQYIHELRSGGDIRHVTLGQLATFTSGFSLPQDHPPWWPATHFTLRRFLDHLRSWQIDKNHQPGKQYIYSHAGFMLLHIALERRYSVPYATLLDQRLLQRLDLSSTTLPLRVGSVGRLAPSLQRRAVQGYSGKGMPIGKPGNMQGYYNWPGTGQMFSSARDMASFLAVHMGEMLDDPALREAAALTHREIAPAGPQVMQAQAWEAHDLERKIIDKNGGLNNTTTYIGTIPSDRIGIVILINRGELNGRDIGHPILLRLTLPVRTAL